MQKSPIQEIMLVKPIILRSLLIVATPYENTYEGHLNESCHTCECVMSLKYEFTYEGHVDESCPAYERVMSLKYEYA